MVLLNGLDLSDRDKVYTSNRDGSFKVVSYINCKKVVIVFEGYTQEHTVTKVHMKSGEVRNRFRPSLYGVGYLGDFRPPTKFKSRAYSVWKGMIKRCYEDSCRGFRFYGKVGVTVSSLWHNFSEFHDWYCENYPKQYEGALELDKDLLSSGVKVYSPETCCVIPSKLNKLVNTKKSRDNGLPAGVTKDKRRGTYYARVKDLGGRPIYLGSGVEKDIPSLSKKVKQKKMEIFREYLNSEEGTRGMTYNVRERLLDLQEI